MLEAREARELSLEDLANILGTSRQMVHKYEAGKVAPSAEAIARISYALKVSPRFFSVPSAESQLMPLFFRQFRSKTRSKHRSAALRQLAWAQRVVEVMEEYVVLPDVNIPNFSPPSDPREIALAQIEESATALRRHWGLGDGVITDVVKLLETNGCIIITNLIDCEVMDGFSQWANNGRPFIVIDCRRVSSTHRRTDLAHELGHLILHSSIDKRFLELNPQTHRLIEDQAFKFAGAFLLPETTFKRSIPYVSLDALLLVKAQWKLSVAAMLQRAETLGMLDHETARRLWINRNRRGWRITEPLDDRIPFEEPQLLAKVVRTLNEANSSWISSLCQETGLYPMDVARYAGISKSELEAGEIQDFPLAVRADAGLRVAH
jgi:Zn-dependent peptidase ImmA (M78 family)/DNA-binding XRE family transcriptional regulator